MSLHDGLSLGETTVFVDDDSIIFVHLKTALKGQYNLEFFY
jgi:hypothetical protein